MESAWSHYQCDHDYDVLIPTTGKGLHEGLTLKGLGDTLLNGVAHQFSVILEMQFLKDARTIGTHRGRAEIHAFGDLRDGLPRG